MIPSSALVSDTDKAHLWIRLEPGCSSYGSCTVTLLETPTLPLTATPAHDLTPGPGFSHPTSQQVAAEVRWPLGPCPPSWKWKGGVRCPPSTSEFDRLRLQILCCTSWVGHVRIRVRKCGMAQDHHSEGVRHGPKRSQCGSASWPKEIRVRGCVMAQDDHSAEALHVLHTSFPVFPRVLCLPCLAKVLHP